MKIRYFLLVIILLFISCFTVTCKATNDYQDADVAIVSTTIENRSVPYEPEYTKWAVIDYTVENIGTKSINGWAVSFNQNFQIGSQLRTSHNVYSSIEPGKTSSVQSTSFLIPSTYHNATVTVLNNIELW